MRMPITAVASLRPYLFLAVLCQAVVGCAGETTAPDAALRQPAGLAPVSASHALAGADDGQYVFTFDPTEAQSLQVGLSHLDIPADAVCRLNKSEYGPEFWDADCKLERSPVTITATVRDAATNHPRIDFEPAMRFAPDKVVTLTLTLDAKARRSAWASIFYCVTGTDTCVDEAATDPDLRTTVDGQTVFRRIKHFSGYIVLSRGDME